MIYVFHSFDNEYSTKLEVALDGPKTDMEEVYRQLHNKVCYDENEKKKFQEKYPGKHFSDMFVSYLKKEYKFEEVKAELVSV